MKLNRHRRWARPKGTVPHRASRAAVYASQSSSVCQLGGRGVGLPHVIHHALVAAEHKDGAPHEACTWAGRRGRDGRGGMVRQGRGRLCRRLYTLLLAAGQPDAPRCSRRLGPATTSTRRSDPGATAHLRWRSQTTPRSAAPGGRCRTHHSAAPRAWGGRCGAGSGCCCSARTAGECRLRHVCTRVRRERVGRVVGGHAPACVLASPRTARPLHKCIPPDHHPAPPHAPRSTACKNLNPYTRLNESAWPPPYPRTPLHSLHKLGHAVHPLRRDALHVLGGQPGGRWVGGEGWGRGGKVEG